MKRTTKIFLGAAGVTALGLVLFASKSASAASPPSPHGSPIGQHGGPGDTPATGPIPAFTRIPPTMNGGSAGLYFVVYKDGQIVFGGPTPIAPMMVVDRAVATDNTWLQTNVFDAVRQNDAIQAILSSSPTAVGLIWTADEQGHVLEWWTA